MNKLELLNRKASEKEMTQEETDELLNHMADIMSKHEVDYEKIEKIMYRGVPKADRKPVHPVRTEPKIGRNDACPCRSGKKYKKCCLKENA